MKKHIVPFLIYMCWVCLLLAIISINGFERTITIAIAYIIFNLTYGGNK